MRHVAAYLMLVLGGNASPSAADVTAALSSVGIDADADRLNTLISELEGKNLEELIEAGKASLATFGGGGGGGGGGAAAGGDAGAEEAPKEDADAGAESAGDMEGGMDMFGDEGGY